MKKYLYFLLVISSAFLMTGCGRVSEPCSQTGFYFDTVIQITLYESQYASALEECFSMAEAYETLFSASKEGSDIWNLNHAKGKPVEISKETYDLLKEAVYYAELTEGKIDPTTLPLSRLWGFYSETDDMDITENIPIQGDSAQNIPASRVPSPEEIETCLSHVDYRLLSLSEENGQYIAVLNDAGAQADLGFIAKGYIADKMKEYLVSQGVESGIIDLGGNILTIGEKPDGSSYSVGIKPLDENGLPVTVLSVTDKSVVTSGIYERCFEENGVSYHHILDAVTGYPAENELYGVTILSGSSMTGDALSTTCMLLGLEDGIQLIESLPETEAVFITKDKTVYKTSGLRT